MNYSKKNFKDIFKYNRIVLFILILAWMIPIHSVSAESIKEDNVHVKTWNKFATDLYELHKRQIKGKKITIKSKKGGYATNKEFYIEKEYYDENNNLLSRIAWEIAKPDNMHVIEIFIYNKKAQVIRDYSAAYLPTYRNAPVQTLINLHQYNKGLHAFRSFDASRDRVLERCEGIYDRKEISFLLDEDDLYALLGDNNGLMYSTDYKLCFDGLQEDLGQYLKPQ